MEKVIWLTGLSGSGKTTLGTLLYEKLTKLGIMSKLLDADIIRKGLNSNLSFTMEDRMENIRRISEVSKLFIEEDILTINCFIAPTEKIRNLAKSIIGKDNFIEIYLKSSIETCKKRDPKGLYKKQIKNFTGIDSIYEEPINPDLILDTENQTIDQCFNILYKYILKNCE
jgi:adenylylsulfate kinase